MSKYANDTARKSITSPFKDVFRQLLEAYKLKDKFDERMVVNGWSALMGNTVAKRTANVSVRNKILYVQVTSGPIKKELMMNKSKVLSLIAAKFGEGVITDVVFL
jgi:predicted nucleic acid-binding Zn ribbon protein